MSGHSEVKPKGKREEHRVRDKKENHAIVIPNTPGKDSPISIHTRKNTVRHANSHLHHRSQALRLAFYPLSSSFFWSDQSYQIWMRVWGKLSARRAVVLVVVLVFLSVVCLKNLSTDICVKSVDFPFIRAPVMPVSPPVCLLPSGHRYQSVTTRTNWHRCSFFASLTGHAHIITHTHAYTV